MEFTDKKEVIPFDRSESELIHMNNITEEYIEYLKSIDPNLLLGTTYTRMTSLNLLKLDRDNVAKIVSMQDLDMSVLPKKFGEEGFVKNSCKCLHTPDTCCNIPQHLESCIQVVFQLYPLYIQDCQQELQQKLHYPSFEHRRID
jgi:hypothetical protein